MLHVQVVCGFSAITKGGRGLRPRHSGLCVCQP
jgi:hypothetical protein